MKTESALTDHFAGLQEIADTITRLREDNALMLAALKWCEARLDARAIDDDSLDMLDYLQAILATVAEREQ